MSGCETVLNRAARRFVGKPQSDHEEAIVGSRSISHLVLVARRLITGDAMASFLWRGLPSKNFGRLTLTGVLWLQTLCTGKYKPPWLVHVKRE